MATRKPATYHCAATRWSLDDLVAALVQRRTGLMSRSSIWRSMRQTCNPIAACTGSTATIRTSTPKRTICVLLRQRSPSLYGGQLVICTDEKTGMQVLQRKYPTQPGTGQPEKREHEYIRHGARALIASFVVPTGEVVWSLGQTRTVTISPPISRRSPSTSGRAALLSGWWTTGYRLEPGGVPSGRSTVQRASGPGSRARCATSGVSA